MPQTSSSFTTLHDAWESYCEVAAPKKTSPAMMKALKSVFYSGAGAFSQALFNATPETPTADEIIDCLEKLDTEIKDFLTAIPLHPTTEQ